MNDLRCTRCHILLARAELYGGTIEIECRRGTNPATIQKCRALNRFGDSGAAAVWEARCFVCSRMIYRYTGDLEGRVETKCRSCGSLDMKSMRRLVREGT